MLQEKQDQNFNYIYYVEGGFLNHMETNNEVQELKEKVVAINRVENTLVKIPEALGKFYGRQYDSSNTIYQLENFLREILESK